MIELPYQKLLPEYEISKKKDRRDTHRPAPNPVVSPFTFISISHDERDTKTKNKKYVRATQRTPSHLNTSPCSAQKLSCARMVTTPSAFATPHTTSVEEEA